MTRRQARKLYEHAHRRFCDGYRIGTNDRIKNKRTPSYLAMGESRSLAWTAGYELATAGKPSPNGIPADVWAQVVAVALLPRDFGTEWRP